MFTRREFFRGTSLGAGGLFLGGFLSQLEAAAGSNPKPMRVVFFLQGNGLYPEQIQPERIERLNNPDRIEDRSLKGHAFAHSVDPLEPFRDRLTFLHGLSGRVARGSHSSDFGALGCFPQSKGAFGETIDAAIAKKLPGLFPHVGLGVGNPNESVIYNVSAWEREKALPTQCDPIRAHHRLFAVAAEGSSRKAFDAKTNLLDFLADDVRRMRTTLDNSEREKLDHYLNAFESMSERQSALLQLSERIKSATPTVDDRFTQEALVFERLEAHVEVAAGALIAGLTNVVTISSGSGLGRTGVSPDGVEIGLDAGQINSHGIGHGASYQGQSSAELHIRIRHAHMEKLAQLVRKLESIPEGDGTMMDNTLIVYTSDSAEGHHPRCEEWPFVLIGDLGGRLQTQGRYLRYPWYGQSGHRTVANLYTTLLHVIGEPRDRFGLPDVALKDLNQDGPLTELLG